MKLKIQCIQWWGIAVFLFASFGCGGSTYPVKGRITFEGKPMVGGGTIMFVPLDDREGKAPGGIIEEDGTYTLSTEGNGDGSMLGEFRVMITQRLGKEPEPEPDGTPPSSGPVDVVPEKDRIPSIYSSHRSPLKATVEAKTNELNFDLKRNADPQGPPGGGA